VRIALANNPDLVAVAQQQIASGYDVNVARAGRLPTLSANLGADYVKSLGNTPGDFPSSGTDTTIGLGASIPIFQGGLPAARIREAQALQGQLREQVVGTERAVVQQTRAAFSTYESAQQAIQAQTVAVQANELALEGNRAEQTVGTRTIIEVLNAEQDLLNSQVALVTAKRDAYVAGFQLLNAMGQAQAQDLGLDGGPLYDPLGNYRRVANNWNDWASDPTHVPTATRTVSPQEMPPNPILDPKVEPAGIDATPPTSPGVTTQPAAPATAAPPPSTGSERGSK
jgi:outer membrane protein